MTHPPRDRHARHDSGMTLIEVLISITLLAMLATMIASGARLSARTWAVAEALSVETDDMDTMRTLLRRSIAAARPSQPPGEARGSIILFAGETDRLTLIAPAPGGLIGGAWVQQTFFVAPDGSGHGLFLTWKADAPERPGVTAGGAPIPLLDRVIAARFQYFGPGPNNTAPTWQDRWTGRAILPDLVRVSIERDTTAGRPWPDLIARTRVTASAACVYDPRGGEGCQRARP